MAATLRLGLATGILAGGSLLGGMTAVAQDSRGPSSTTAPRATGGDANALEEVTVTAERFGSTVQTTPVAVTAFTPETLATRQVTNVLEAAPQIPGIVITPATGTSNAARIVLRGAGQEQSGINFDPAVGIYVDNVYQPRINGGFFDFFDIDRLEVLRGPQGTLYGRNTSGGAIKIETRRPSFDWGGGAELTGGEWSTWDGKLYVTGPIVPGRLAFSFSGVTRNRDGFIWGPAYDRNIGNMKRRAERAKLLWTPSDAVSVQVAAYAMQDYSDPGVGVPLQVGVGVVDPYAVPGRDLTRTEVFGPMGQRLNNTGASINATWQVNPALALNATTGYGNLRQQSTGSILWITAAAQQTGNGLLNLGAGGDGRTRDWFWSQELNATYSTERLKGVAGVYFFREDGETHSRQVGTPNDQYRRTKAYAAFAQGTLSLGGGVGVTAGLRYTKEDADFTQYYFTQFPRPQSLSESFTGTTPKLGVNWQILPDWMAYASWTKGFKSGGINPVPPASNTGVPGRAGEPIAYDPEKVDSYEVGTKFDTPNRRLRLNLAVFQARYKGLQLPVFFPGTSTSYTSNASGAIVEGIEAEPTWQVLDQLQVYGSLAWTRGHYTQSFICSGADTRFRDCSGNYIKGVVPNKSIVGFTWSPPLPIPGQLRLLGQ